jgi:hypothetical protein
MHQKRVAKSSHSILTFYLAKWRKICIKSVYYICLYRYNIQILYRFFSISPDKTSRYCGWIWLLFFDAWFQLFGLFWMVTGLPIFLISLRLGFRRNFLSVLHPNLVSSPIKGILEILNLTPRGIPMDILAWTDCVRSSAGKIS